MASRVLVLLGNENDINEVLSEAAIIRANLALEMVKENNDFLILPTGSFGYHFNVSCTPHGKLLESFLLKNGVNQEKILPFTRTSNTLEDAYGVLKYLEENKSVNEVHIITSSFHMKRVKYIFGRVLQGYVVEYHEAGDPQDTAQLEKQRKHEKNVLRRLSKEWVDISNFDLGVFPAQGYENIGYELRHYDNLSYFAIVGAFVCFGFIANDNLSDASLFKAIKYGGGIFLIILFWYLYQRLANTATAARRVLNSIEKLYGVPGLSSTQYRTRIFRTNLTVQSTISWVMVTLIVYLLIESIKLIIA